MYITTNKLIQHPHPWEPHIPEGARFLLLGTFPTAQKRPFEFYYPNPKNKLWKLLPPIAQMQLQYANGPAAVDERKALLDKLQLGMADMGRHVIRIAPGSADVDLIPVEYNDIFSLLENHPTISTIILAGSSGNSSPAGWFTHYSMLNGINISLPEGQLPRSTDFRLGDKTYQLRVIRSPARLTVADLSPYIEQYRSVLQQK